MRTVWYACKLYMQHMCNSKICVYVFLFNVYLKHLVHIICNVFFAKWIWNMKSEFAITETRFQCLNIYSNLNNHLLFQSYLTHLFAYQSYHFTIHGCLSIAVLLLSISNSSLSGLVPTKAPASSKTSEKNTGKTMHLSDLWGPFCLKHPKWIFPMIGYFFCAYITC